MKGRLKRAGLHGRLAYQHYDGLKWHRVLVRTAPFKHNENAKEASPEELLAIYGFEASEPSYQPLFLKPSAFLTMLDQNLKGEWRLVFGYCGCKPKCHHESAGWATLFFELDDDLVWFKLKETGWIEQSEMEKQ